MKDNVFCSLFHLDDRASMAKKPRDRMEALLECQDTSAAVQALDPIEFYDLYHAVGPGDAMMLLEYASGEQFQMCLDLDIWRGDELRDDELTPWVEAMLACPDEKFQEFWSEIDPEVLGLYLHRNVHLYVSEDKNDEVDIPDEESKNVAQSPDFTYWIAYQEDSDKAEMLRQLIDRMYAVLGIDKAWSALENMHFEMETDLEETAYHFRTERIREYGFMPKDEAAALFFNVDVQAESKRMRNEVSGELYVKAFHATSKLDSALAAIDESPAADCYFGKILTRVQDLEAIRYQLLSMAQQIATVDGFQPHEDQGFEESMLLAVSYVSMGLEYASEHDDDLAERLLRHIALRRLFSLGYSLTEELHRKAKILISRGHLSIIEDQKMSLLTTAQRDAVEGMLLDRPRPAASSLTPFVSLRDIQSCAAVIADVATRELVFGEALHKNRDDISLLAYTNEIVVGVENVNFDNVAVTFLTRRAIGLDPAWGVFDVDNIPTRETVLEAVSLDNIRTLFKSSSNDAVVTALARYAHQLRTFVEEQWPVNVKKPDPRLMGALLIVSDDE